MVKIVTFHLGKKPRPYYTFMKGREQETPVARSILILDTPAQELADLVQAFRDAGRSDVEIEVLTTTRDLLARLRGGLACDLVVIDFFLGDGKKSGEEILRQVRKADPLVPLVAVAREGDVDTADRAILAGATDFLVRGDHLALRVGTLLGKVRNLLQIIEQNRILGEQNLLFKEADRARYRIVGESPQILDVIRRVERVARIPRPVLILGERGTGKELVARAIHEAAGERNRPFVAVNCAAFTDTLLESELFGHEKGAFTGADSLVHGKFEQAKGGSLFLDEIGNMSLPFQQKILRAVEYGVFTRVGGRQEIETDARIIAATNAQLEKKMATGVFMRDLYDRLAFEVIQVPSLREREGDIEILARHFLNEFMQEIPALGGKRLAQSAIQALRAYSFPGNVRELKNIIERAAYRDVTNEITPEDIGMLPEPDTLPEMPGRNFEEKLQNYERRLVLDALAQAGGNQAQAARDLGLSYHQYRYYLKKHEEAAD